MSYDYKVRKVYFIKKRIEKLEKDLENDKITKTYFNKAIKNYKKELLIFERSKVFTDLWLEIIKLKKYIDEWNDDLTDDFNKFMGVKK